MLALALLLSCFGTEARLDAEEQAVQDAMEEHWRDATAARDALVRADLDAARTHARTLRKRLPIKALPERTRPLQDTVAARALQLEQATSLLDAGEALGALATACGECHAVMGAEALADPPPAPFTDDSTKAHMVRHQWALDRVWLGLVRRDPTLITIAVDVLQQSDLVPTGTAVGASVPPEAAELELRVHDLAAQVARGETMASRGRSYGQLVATCAGCHQLMQGGPAAE